MKRESPSAELSKRTKFLLAGLALASVVLLAGVALIARALAEADRQSIAAVVSMGIAGVLAIGIGFHLVRQNARLQRRSESPAEDITRREEAEDRLAASGEQFRALAESIPQLAWMANPDGHIFWYNRRWYDYTGTDFGQMQGWGWQSVHDPVALPIVMEKWTASIATGHPFDMVFPLKGADGVFRAFLTRIEPVKDDGGRVVRWFGTNTDISEAKRAEELLRHSERRLRAIMDSLPQKVFTATATGAVDYCNPSWAEYTGVAPGEGGWAKYLHPDDGADTARIWQHSMATGRPFQSEHRFRSADGEYRWHISRARALADADGRVAMWVGANTDIDDQRRTADELRDVAARLSEADRRKDEFLATLAHELRNPLAPIRNALQVMRLAPDDGETVEKARTMMERQIAQMVRLVDDLLDVSRISRGKLDLRLERVELAAVLSSALETSRPLIEAGGHALTVVLPPDPILLDADMTRLAQVFANVLNNAAKYSDPGGRIAVVAELRGDAAVVSVRDTGVGIPPDMIPTIFDLFTQVDRSLEKSQGGLGIGLSLVKRLVEMHGGTVEARSDGQGLGSEFAVRLPVIAGEPTAEPPRPIGASEAPSVRRRIAVADDNVDSAESLGQLLELLGNDVRTANDGMAAVALAAEFRPDVILLDIGMPKLNGYEACRRIREQPWGKTAVIIALTGWGQDDDRRLSKEAGFDHHLVKPVDPAELERLLAASGAGADRPSESP